MDSSAIAESRQTKLAVLASEINAHHQAAEAALNRGLEEAHKCGELLLEAKAACPHGTWQKWLSENFRGSMRTAQCYMRIANHWAEIEAKSADSALLSIDGAVKLLAAPKPPALDVDTLRARIDDAKERQAVLFDEIDAGKYSLEEGVELLLASIKEGEELVRDSAAATLWEDRSLGKHLLDLKRNGVSIKGLAKSLKLQMPYVRQVMILAAVDEADLRRWVSEKKSPWRITPFELVRDVEAGLLDIDDSAADLIDAADPGFKIDKWFLDIGGSLRQIRDGRLYRETHRDFYAYCRDKWELEREEVDQFIQSANWLEASA